MLHKENNVVLYPSFLLPTVSKKKTKFFITIRLISPLNIISFDPLTKMFKEEIDSMM